MASVEATIISLTIVIIISESCATSEICQQAGINFTRVLDSVVARENEMASIPCGFYYDGPRQPLPFWRFQQVFGQQKSIIDLYPEALPPNYYYNEASSSLVIIKVDQSYNNATFSCFLDIFHLRAICKSNETVILVVSSFSTVPKELPSRTTNGNYISSATAVDNIHIQQVLSLLLLHTIIIIM